MGSITKTVTFATVMQLVEDGKINLSEDIRAYIGHNFFRRTKKRVTMANLMLHNAGWEEVQFGTSTVSTETG